MEKWEPGGRGSPKKIIMVLPRRWVLHSVGNQPQEKLQMKTNQTDELAEQLLEAEKQYPKGHVLTTPKQPTAEEKEKAAQQHKDMQDDLGK
jgi:hypothetical protein